MTDRVVTSTMGFSKSKWYCEVKITTQGGRNVIGISNGLSIGVIEGGNGTTIRNAPAVWAGYKGHDGTMTTSGTDNGDLGSGASDDDILCMAMDMDNGQVHYNMNADVDITGTAQCTGLTTTTGEFFHVYYNETSATESVNVFNFGNPPFSISSGNADAAGYGSFEYAVPSGYYALCTKNLAEYG